LGADFKQPPIQSHSKMVKRMRKKKKSKPLIEQNKTAQTDKEEMDKMEEEEKEQKMDEHKEENGGNEEYEMVEEEEEVLFEFNSSDFQRYLDANSEIIGRLQAIRSQKTFFGVTKEEIDLNQQFAQNTATIIRYSSLPNRLLC